MRFYRRFSKRFVVMAVVTVAIGTLGAAPYAAAPEPVRVALGPDGCPRSPLDEVPYGWGEVPWGPAHVRGLAEGTVTEALLCRMTYELGGGDGWLEPLHLTRRARDLQTLVEDLPRADTSGATTMEGYAPANLVLRHADGRSTVLAFDFNWDVVRSPRAQRGGAAHLHNAFLRLWRAETARSPTEVPPAECPARLPRDYLAAPRHPAPGPVRDFVRYSAGPPLPSPLAVVRACRYTTDATGRLVLRAQGTTREHLPELRPLIAAATDPDATGSTGDFRRYLACVRTWLKKGVPALDTLHATDVTGRTVHLTLPREPCDGRHRWLFSGPLTPEAAALMAQLLD
ncbi:hypothetical protein GCM10022221_32290 [Actinocorallia aurea]